MRYFVNLTISYINWHELLTARWIAFLFLCNFVYVCVFINVVLSSSGGWFLSSHFNYSRLDLEKCKSVTFALVHSSFCVFWPRHSELEHHSSHTQRDWPHYQGELAMLSHLGEGDKYVYCTVLHFLCYLKPLCAESVPQYIILSQQRNSSHF